MGRLKKAAVDFIWWWETMHYRLMRLGSKITYRCKVRKHHLKNVDTNVLTKQDIGEIKTYWKQCVRDFDIAYHKYYAGVTGKADHRFIPDDIHICWIDPYFNNRAMHSGVCDKNYFDVWFRDAIRPASICRVINGFLYDGAYRLIEKEEAIDLLMRAGSFVVKPSRDSAGGSGIRFVTAESREQLSKELEDLHENDVIFQEVIRQHPELSRINASSVNTLRIMTLLFKGKVYLVQSILRMGVGDAQVDNALSGGICCGINPDGSLKDVAFDIFGKKFLKHPQGFEFHGFVVPGYQAACEMALREAEKMANFRLISWDIAINENAEPVLIEANLQAGGIGVLQASNGPLFGDMTDEVLEEVFGKNRK